MGSTSTGETIGSSPESFGDADDDDDSDSDGASGASSSSGVSWGMCFIWTHLLVLSLVCAITLTTERIMRQHNNNYYGATNLWNSISWGPYIYLLRRIHEALNPAQTRLQ